MHPVLAGKRVIELGTMVAAPFAAHMLAQFGAEVIKVEPPSGDPTRKMVRGGPSGTFIAYSRGKRSVCIDLKRAQGQDVLRRLIAAADVVVHNLTPGSARSLGVTHADCVKANPRLVYCHIQGYGPGPLEEELASNPVIEASTGVMYTHRIDGRPTRLGPSYHDQFAGMYAVMGILAALQAPENDVNARRVEVGLYETGLHVASRDLVNGQLKSQLGVKTRPDADQGEFSMPGYGSYETSDGRWVYLVMLSDAHWAKFCEAMALPQVSDASLASIRERKRRGPEVEAIVSAAMRAHTFVEAMTRLKSAGVGCTEVKPLATVLDEPHAREAGKLGAVKFQALNFSVPNMPLPWQVATDGDELPPPLLGEHTQDVLMSIGYSAADVEGLRAGDVVRIAQSDGRPIWAPPRRPA